MGRSVYGPGLMAGFRNRGVGLPSHDERLGEGTERRNGLCP
jgi:hypothetical protein